MRINLIKSLLVATPILLAANVAEAATFEFNSAVGGNPNVGVHKNITTRFDDETDMLSWSSTFSKNNDVLANGAWLVLSEGPNPKSHVQEYAMFYLDGKNETLTAYTYNGVNGSDSWSDPESEYLGSWGLDVSTSADGNERTFSFDLDMTDINNRTDLGADWKGSFFGEEVGIWYHGVENVEATYFDDGRIDTFTYDSHGWFDAKDLATTKVPEPGAIAGLAAISLLAAKTLRRKSA